MEGAIIMAVEKVSLAFGPEKGLRLEQEKYPERHLKLLKSVTDENKFLLLDSSNQKSIFHAGLNYETRHEIGEESWQGFFEFRYFTLAPEQKDLLASLVQKWENNYEI